MQVVNSNVASLNAQRQLDKTNKDVNTAIQRLSSGLRINSAKDDAAGLAISNRMTAQIKGLNQAARNANDGVSVAQVAEGALGEIGNMLQRMRELSVQSASDSNGAADRASLQKEFAQLNSEIDRIAGQTEFNGKKLLNGTFSGQSFQVGAYANQTIAVSMSDARSTALGAYTGTSNSSIGAAMAGGTAPSVNGVAAQTLTLVGPSGSTTVGVTANDSAKAIADNINLQTGTTGIAASARTEATIGNFAAASQGAVSFTLGGRTTATVNATVNSATDLSSLADAINQQSARTGVSATLSGNKASISLVSDEGFDITVADAVGGGPATTAVFDVTNKAGTAVTLAEGGNDSVTASGQVSYSATGAFSIATSAGATLTGGTGTTAVALASVSNSKVDTAANSQSAITTIDGAINFVNDLRATLGAVQSRFESATSNLRSQAENISAARSRVQDTDFAQETAALSRAQILQQAGTAMLAQANSLPQGVLSLLRG
jgi:flagellin